MRGGAAAAAAATRLSAGAGPGPGRQGGSAQIKQYEAGPFGPRSNKSPSRSMASPCLPESDTRAQTVRFHAMYPNRAGSSAARPGARLGHHRLSASPRVALRALRALCLRARRRPPSSAFVRKAGRLAGGGVGTEATSSPPWVTDETLLPTWLSPRGWRRCHVKSEEKFCRRTTDTLPDRQLPCIPSAGFGGGSSFSRDAPRSQLAPAPDDGSPKPYRSSVMVGRVL